MGSNTSKTINDATVAGLKNDLENSGNQDPRSPTPEITRTPLQGKTGAKHNITKNVDLRKTFENGTTGEEKLIHNNPILSAVIKNHLQSYDPRSPTQDFERTPIVVADKINDVANKKMLMRIQSETIGSPVLRPDDDDGAELDDCMEASERSPDLVVSRNLCDGFYNITLDDTIKDSEEPLGSSTASNEAIENNITSTVPDVPSKLLETNFDYIECDNDKFEDSEDNIKGIDNSTSADVDTKHNLPVFQILDVDPRSPSIGIERTPIVVAKTEDNSIEEIVENMSDDTLIKVLQNTNTELRLNLNLPDKNVEGLLVYEDEDNNLNDTPKKSKSSSSSGSRTPLSCMKNKADVGHARSKSANTLFDPMSQKTGLSKIPKRVSHIPRLKCLSKQGGIGAAVSTVSLKNLSKATAMAGDCENTPPHSHRDIWDKDTSIVL